MRKRRFRARGAFARGGRSRSSITMDIATSLDRLVDLCAAFSLARDMIV
jgi:hypothetical protein